jgi:diguanylate cyclase (GGDEF)-like protein
MCVVITGTAVFLTDVLLGDQVSPGAATRALVISIVIGLPVTIWITLHLKKNIELVAELQRLLNRDRLTDVATRDHFFERMEQTISQTGVVLMVDIDRFKSINDSYGHLVGDRVISRIARVLDRETRATDIVARFGGEEFVVYLADTEPGHGVAIADRVRRKIETADIYHKGERVTITASIGVAELRDVAQIEDGIKRADDALYAAKRAGRNRVVDAAKLSAADKVASTDGTRSLEATPQAAKKAPPEPNSNAA